MRAVHPGVVWVESAIASAIVVEAHVSLLAVAVAAGVGLAIAAQATILGGASRAIHPLSVSLALQVAGAVIGLAWMAYARTWSEVIEVATRWWWLPLGLLGLVVVAALGFSSARLGALTTLGIVIAAQLGGALLLDFWSGASTLGPRQPIGIAVVLLGVLLLSSRS